jgi:nitroreductase
MDLITAMKSRQSTRAFLNREVAEEKVHAILDAARWAPSGVNMQPWQVAVVSGSTRQRLSQALIDASAAGTRPNPDYHYYPDEWFEPYKSRRKATGMALYGALHVDIGDTEGRKEAWYNNYRFFGAPTGLLLFLDKRLGQGSWVDVGMFLQNIMLAAESEGLATCPQAALADYPDIVRDLLGIEESQAFVGSLSLGYPDPAAEVNGYRTPREPVEAFTRWFD